MTTTTTVKDVTYTKTPTTVIDEAAQDTINIILWGASGTALLILLIRLLISGVNHCRHRNQRNLPLDGNRSTCTLHDDPPPNYSQISIRPLPPTYSQGCRIIHYHPSTGNYSQEAQSSNMSTELSNVRTYSFENDFTVPQSTSSTGEFGNDVSDNTNIPNADEIQDIEEDFTVPSRDPSMESNTDTNIPSNEGRTFENGFLCAPTCIERTDTIHSTTNSYSNINAIDGPVSSRTDGMHTRSNTSPSYTNQSYDSDSNDRVLTVKIRTDTE